MRIDFANPDDILNFTLTIDPDEGMYKGGSFKFTFAISSNYPHDPPKVKCTQKIYHPNIDLEGNVCLNILREDWKPVLNLNAVVVGMQVRMGGADRIGQSMHRLLQTRFIIVNSRLTLLPVSLPRTQRIRPSQQGSSRRSQDEQGELQAER